MDAKHERSRPTARLAPTIQLKGNFKSRGLVELTMERVKTRRGAGFKATVKPELQTGLLRHSGHYRQRNSRAACSIVEDGLARRNHLHLEVVVAARVVIPVVIRKI